MKYKFLYLFAILYAIPLLAQNKTLQLDGKSSPIAVIEDAEWIAGHWRGEAFGGITEEIWSPPLGESMMFVFKLINGDSVLFYESGAIIEENESLILKLKHFNRDYSGWEEKDETVDFKLVKVDPNAIYFEGFTFEKISDDEINIYVDIKDETGNISETIFNYKRFDKGCK